MKPSKTEQTVCAIWFVVAFAALLASLAFAPDNPAAWTAVGTLFLSGAHGLVRCLRWQLTVDGETLWVQPAFGKARRCNASQITHILRNTWRSQFLVIYTDAGWRCMVEENVDGYAQFRVWLAEHNITISTNA